MLGQVIHEQPSQNTEECEDRHPDHRRVVNVNLFVAKRPGFAAENPYRDDERNRQLHYGDSEVTQAGIQTKRESLHAFGKEETDIGHGGSECAAADSGKGREHDKGHKGGVGILKRESGTLMLAE